MVAQLTAASSVSGHVGCGLWAVSARPPSVAVSRSLYSKLLLGLN
jgi:hypothetical protein